MRLLVQNRMKALLLDADSQTVVREFGNIRQLATGQNIRIDRAIEPLDVYQGGRFERWRPCASRATHIQNEVRFAHNEFILPETLQDPAESLTEHILKKTQILALILPVRVWRPIIPVRCEIPAVIPASKTPIHPYTNHIAWRIAAALPIIFCGPPKKRQLNRVAFRQDHTKLSRTTRGVRKFPRFGLTPFVVISPFRVAATAGCINDFHFRTQTFLIFVLNVLASFPAFPTDKRLQSFRVKRTSYPFRTLQAAHMLASESRFKVFAEPFFTVSLKRTRMFVFDLFIANQTGSEISLGCVGFRQARPQKPLFLFFNADLHSFASHQGCGGTDEWVTRPRPQKYAGHDSGEGNHNSHDRTR